MSRTREAAVGRLTSLRKPETGFTLVELVLVLLVLAVLSAAVAPRWFARTAFDARSYAEELAAAMRYARQIAVTGCPVQFSLTAGGYSAQRQASFCTGGYNQPLTGPEGDALVGVAPAGVAVTGVPLTVIFASDGATNLAADANLTVGGHALRLYAATGVVEQP